MYWYYQGVTFVLIPPLLVVGFGVIVWGLYAFVRKIMEALKNRKDRKTEIREQQGNFPQQSTHYKSTFKHSKS